MRIFTLKEIIDGKIPSLEDFRQAKDEFETILRTYIDQDKVLGALFYGSVSDEDFNPASDLDCLVVVKDLEDKILIEEEAEKIAQKYNIPFEPQVHPEDTARMGSHTIYKGYLRTTLEYYAEKNGYLGINPLDLLGENYVDPEFFISHAIKSSSRTLDRSYTKKKGARYYRMLDNILSRPLHSLRYAIVWHNLTSGETLGHPMGKKEEIYESFKELDYAGDLLVSIDKIFSVRSRYIDFLSNAIGEIDKIGLEKEYLGLLSEIENCFYDARRIMKRIAGAIDSKSSSLS